MTRASKTLDIDGVTIAYGGTLATADVSLQVEPRTIVGLVGESGSGKSTLALAAMGYLPAQASALTGASHLEGHRLLGGSPRERREAWRRNISYVSQDARQALNPARRIGVQLREVLVCNTDVASGAWRSHACQLLEAVRLLEPEAALRRYPHEFSGGQLQRIALALALACDPSVLILDEPTTGLDVTTQSEVTAMLTDLVRERDLGVLYISHDLALLATIADEIAVMYAGELVEIGAATDVIGQPRHPYTRALLDSMLSTAAPVRAAVLAGLPPGRVVSGACAFADRCSYEIDDCRVASPAMTFTGTQGVRCHRTATLGHLSARPRAGVPPHPPAGADLLLEAHDLSHSYDRKRLTHALDHVSIRVAPGEVVAVVGESGSGKSTLGRLLSGVTPIQQGVVTWRGAVVPNNPARRSRELRRELQLIFQNPDASLNPRRTIGAQLARVVSLFGREISPSTRTELVEASLREVQLDPLFADRYPHQMSGGQKQRVALARALLAQPRLVICDEIVSGQDVSVQAAILELIRDLQARQGIALLFITHDLAVVRSLAQEVVVLEKGRIVESGRTEAIFDRPQHPYTQRLLDSAPTLTVGA